MEDCRLHATRNNTNLILSARLQMDNEESLGTPVIPSRTSTVLVLTILPGVWTLTRSTQVRILEIRSQMLQTPDAIEH
jgi:hypothetical protein